MNIEFVFDILEKYKDKKILIQIPEGLYKYVSKLSQYGDVDFVYGACDIKLELLNYYDKIIHIGHYSIIKHPKVEYIPLYFDLDTSNLEEELKNFEKVCLVGSIQFNHIVKKYVDNKKVFSFKGKLTTFGQVLGCDISAVKFTPVICISDGNFHPLSCYMQFREVYKYDGKLKEFKSDLLDKRLKLLGIIEGSESCCVVLCRKFLQFRPKRANYIKKLLISKGYKISSIIIDEFNMEKLKYLECDFYVFTGCPHVCFEYNNVFTPSEIECALNRENYKMEQLWF